MPSSEKAAFCFPSCIYSLPMYISEILLTDKFHRVWFYLYTDSVLKPLISNFVNGSAVVSLVQDRQQSLCFLHVTSIAAVRSFWLRGALREPVWLYTSCSFSFDRDLWATTSAEFAHDFSPPFYRCKPDPQIFVCWQVLLKGSWQAQT